MQALCNGGGVVTTYANHSVTMRLPSEGYAFVLYASMCALRDDMQAAAVRDVMLAGKVVTVLLEGETS
jgi:hypothetical protein